jgi:A/G-specific adenine glycosylase
VREHCRAFRHGTQAERPGPRKAKPTPHEDTAVAVMEHEGRTLLVRRPVDARLGGMWAFPAAVRRRGESVAAAAERAVREGLALEVRAGAAIGTVKHAFTHVRASYHAVRCTLLSGEPRPLHYDAWAWATPAELSPTPSPSPSAASPPSPAEPSLFSAGLIPLRFLGASRHSLVVSGGGSFDSVYTIQS